jgi:hypothetical protein
MKPFMFAILVGTFGAVLQELLFWYNAKTKLATEEYRAILTSPGYWIIVTAMAIGSGISAYIWFSPDMQAARTYLLFGAAFPVLFKKAVEAFIPTQTKLGAEREGKKPSKKNTLTDYFKAS